jgi:hypothetical protein
MVQRILPAWLLVGVSVAYSQTPYTGRFDIYGGFAYLDSPHIHRSASGFHVQSGVRPRTWLSLGFDYTVGVGNTTIIPAYLTTVLQNQLAAQLAALTQAGIIPADYKLAIPVHSHIQTFAAGPQLSWHPSKFVTLFARPSIGAIRGTAILQPGDLVVARFAAQLAPGGQKSDWAAFYGAGGGATIRVTNHLGLRLQADFLRDHLFSDLLRNGRNTLRLSIGPSLQFGQNVTN